MRFSISMNVFMHWTYSSLISSHRQTFFFWKEFAHIFIWNLAIYTYWSPTKFVKIQCYSWTDCSMDANPWQLSKCFLLYFFLITWHWQVCLKVNTLVHKIWLICQYVPTMHTAINMSLYIPLSTNSTFLTTQHKDCGFILSGTPTTCYSPSGLRQNNRLSLN